MPLYEYRCMACDERSERLVAHSAVENPGPCPTCDGELRRLWSRVGVKLSGWGFRGTDSMVADRPGRGEFSTIAERAERIADG